MPFEKGQSGNPGGRRKEKPFLDALRLALSAEDGPDKKKLRTIAEKLVACAINGDSWAIQEVANRLDGKPVQALEGNSEGDPITVVLRQFTDGNSSSGE